MDNQEELRQSARRFAEAMDRVESGLKEARTEFDNISRLASAKYPWLGIRLVAGSAMLGKVAEVVGTVRRTVFAFAEISDA